MGLDYNDLNFTQPGRKHGTPKYPIERRKATIGHRHITYRVLEQFYELSFPIL